MEPLAMERAPSDKRDDLEQLRIHYERERAFREHRRRRLSQIAIAVVVGALVGLAVAWWLSR